MKTNKNKNQLVPYNKSNMSTWARFDNLFESLDRLFWSSVNSYNIWRVEEITEKDGNFNVELKLPGFTKEQIKVSVVNNTLRVSAKNDESNYLRSFYYSNWDADKAVTKLQDDVLTVTVPKVEPKKVELPPTKVIEIQ